MTFFFLIRGSGFLTPGFLRFGKWAVTFIFFVPRRNSISTDWPHFTFLSARDRPNRFLTGLSPILMMISPAFSPALAPGVLAVTLTTRAPFL